MVDFKGQQLAERLMQIITIASTIAGFIYGWYLQSFEVTFQAWAAGLAIAGVVCVPDWWFYRKNPIEWREPEYDDSVSQAL
jgi:signal peptidase complex subunit 1